MTPQYLAARVEVRERRALSEYRTARAIYLGHLWSDDERVNRALREALVARARWTMLHDLQLPVLRIEPLDDDRVARIETAEDLAVAIADSFVWDGR